MTRIDERAAAGEIEAAIREKARTWVEEYGKDFLIELIDVYLEDAPKRLRELRRSLAAGDIEAFIRQAHTLKSSSAEVGAAGLSSMAKELESLGRAGRLDDELATKLSELEQTYGHVHAALRSVRAAHGGQ